MADKSAEQLAAERFRTAVRDALGNMTLDNIELRTVNQSLVEKIAALTPPPAPEGSA